MNTTKTTALAATLIAALLSAAPATAKPAETTLSCTAAGTVDTSMAARWRERGTRKKFNAEFEAAPGLGYRAGQPMTVFVDTVKVGTRRLAVQLNGDVGAELELDSRLGTLPGNFPATKVGTKITIKIGKKTALFCALR